MILYGTALGTSTGTFSFSGPRKATFVDANTRHTLRQFCSFKVPNNSCDWSPCEISSKFCCKFFNSNPFVFYIENTTKMSKGRLIILFPWLLLWWSTLAPRLISVEAVVQQQSFRRTPKNQTATEGDKVTLACSIVNKNGTLQWTKDRWSLGTDRNMNWFERYRVEGTEGSGDYNLVIEQVTLEDDGLFQCQVSPGELRSPYAKLTVKIPTEPPKIMQGDLLLTTEDTYTEIECRSNGGKPAAQITWLDGMGQEIKMGVTTKQIVLDDAKRFTTKSVLRFRPLKEYHNKTFTCQAHNRPAKKLLSTFIRLQVKYAPKVSVQILSRLPIWEFDNVRIMCQADANPSEITRHWYLNDKPVANHSTILVLANVTRRFHDSIIKCQVRNAVGNSEDTETLEIKHRVQFLVPQHLELWVILTCVSLGVVVLIVAITMMTHCRGKVWEMEMMEPNEMEMGSEWSDQ